MARLRLLRHITVIARGDVEMTPDQIRELVLQSYEIYDRGERASFVDLFDDESEWTMYLPPEAMPFPNRVRGKFAVLQALKRVDEVVEIIRNEIDVLVVEGDRAAVICDRSLRLRASGRVMRYKTAAFHRYRDGRLIEYIAFADGLDLMQQSLGREIVLPEAFPRGPATRT
jgi:ketosteroid isomerase-like protein